AMRQVGAEKIVAAIRRREPELLDQLIEDGVVRRDWVEHPSVGPVTDAKPLEVVERALAGLVERRPSVLASVGLSAVELLSTAAAAHGPTEVRASVTVAFTDLESFTQFTAREGDAAAAELLNGHYLQAGRIVRGRGGRVVKHLGDGLLLTFPEPAGAVLAALELVEAAPEPLRLRAGLHTGDVLVEGEDVIGHVVNVAARVTESARGGEVLISRDLRDALVPDDVAQVAIGRPRTRRVKGLDDPVAVCAVTRA
ncbi:MAG: adenylate/guanylate cyclase domain-containing protein, partial [Actinomycetota bacterium]